MFLQSKERGILVEVLDVKNLVDPVQDKIHVQVQAGEEEQEPEEYAKTDLVFPSGENLPRCWVDADYRNN